MKRVRSSIFVRRDGPTLGWTHLGEDDSLTSQTPIGSGFGYRTTADEVLAAVDLSGQTAVVTGGASGIGLETTRALAAAGARVVVAARDEAAARETLAGLDKVEVACMDLADPTSIDRFADEYLGSRRPLHILVNNAGVMFTPFGRDGRGYETQFATNHLGHFQLALRLWPALRQADGARIVALSSRGHRFSPVDFKDPNFERRAYDRVLAYGQSKTANILFAVSADARGAKDGIRAFAVHPGRILSTKLTRHMSAEEVGAIPVLDQDGRPFDDPASFVKSSQQGAATSVWCAAGRQLDGEGGVYCEDCDVASMAPPDSQGLGVRGYAVDGALADRLWLLSERLIGVASGQ